MKKDINPSLDDMLPLTDEKKKIKTTQEDYDNALASEDPTKITKEEQERLTREAVKKFKSLS